MIKIVAGSRGMEQQVVALCGASLFMAGVETSLKGQPGLDVVKIDITLPNIEIHLKSLRPDVIIFDYGDARLDTLPGIAQLLKESPGVRVIGLDLTSNDVTILSGQLRSATRVEDLVEAIRMETGHGTGSASTGSSNIVDQ